MYLQRALQTVQNFILWLIIEKALYKIIVLALKSVLIMTLINITLNFRCSWENGLLPKSVDVSSSLMQRVPRPFRSLLSSLADLWGWDSLYLGQTSITQIDSGRLRKTEIDSDRLG